MLRNQGRLKLSVTGGRLWMVLTENLAMLAQQSLLLHFDYRILSRFLLLCNSPLLELHLALSSVDLKLLLPETLDFTFVLKFLHTLLLGVHLLDAVVLRELLHHLAAELLLHALLFAHPLFLQHLLVLLRPQQVLAHPLDPLRLFPLLASLVLFELLLVELVAQPLNILLLSTTLLLLGFQLVEDCLTLLFHHCLLLPDLPLTLISLLLVLLEHHVLLFL